MASDLKNIYENLKRIKESLVKLSYSKRTEDVLQSKLNEAYKLRQECYVCSDIISKQVKGQALSEVQSYCDSINDLYLQIETFCAKDYSSQSSSRVDLGVKSDIMEKFNFKTAVSMLPLMTGDEQVTRNLMDAIELYSSALDDQGKSMLIKFVLKTRLTQNAKLRLLESYDSCDELLSDMRNHLLTKTSDTAIHNELVQIKQNSSSLDDYGSKIEKLFVDLTISQADGDQKAFKILRPLNEKIAVRSFVSGLRNRRISTILTARNYTALKDAIRGAKDEEASCSRQNKEEFVYFGNQSNSGMYRNFRGRFRGNSARRFEHRPVHNNGLSNNPRASYSPRGHPQYTRTFTRGYNYKPRGHFQSNNHRMHFMNSGPPASAGEPNNVMSNWEGLQTDNNATSLEFFRA